MTLTLICTPLSRQAQEKDILEVYPLQLKSMSTKTGIKLIIMCNGRGGLLERVAELGEVTC